MRLRYNTLYMVWETCYTQSGASNGWSSWEEITRDEALVYIERGFEIERF